MYKLNNFYENPRSKRWATHSFGVLPPAGSES